MPTTKPTPKKPTHGGARAGAGRPPSTGRRGGPQTVIRWSQEERDGVVKGVGTADAIAGIARDVMLELAPHYDSVSASLYPTETFADFVAVAVGKELRARNGGSIEPRRKA